MSVLDGLTEEQKAAAVEVANGVRSRIAQQRKAGLIEGTDVVLTADEALALARFHAIRHARHGDPEPTASDALYVNNELRPIDGAGRIFKGDGSAVDDTLQNVQAALIKLIDAKAESNITSGAGFTHSGKQFSLSLAAQTKWNGLYNSRATITYPYLVPTRDDQGFHSIADAAEVEAMYAAAVAAVTGELGAANAVKQTVVAAATTADARSAADAYLT